jgi:hypothetical protein
MVGLLIVLLRETLYLRHEFLLSLLSTLDHFGF